jgi:hypothetical protein
MEAGTITSFPTTAVAGNTTAVFKRITRYLL